MNKKIARNIVSFLFFFGFLVFAVHAFSFVSSSAALASFEIPFLPDNVRKIGEQGGETISVPYFTDINLSDQGTRGIVLLIKRVIRFLQYVFGSIGVVFIFIAGYRLLIAGGQIEEVATAQKKNVQWILIGFVVITIADQVVNNVFFRNEGAFLDNPVAAQAAAQEGVKYLRQIVDFFVAFVGTVAVLAIIVSGMRMVMSPGNEEVINAQKKVFMWAAIGLVMISLADRIIYIFYGDAGQKGINVQAGLVEIAGFTNYILMFLGVIAAASLVYAGILIIANFGNAEVTSKAKKVVIDVIIGVAIAFSAYTIVSAIVRLGQ